MDFWFSDAPLQEADTGIKGPVIYCHKTGFHGKIIIAPYETEEIK